ALKIAGCFRVPTVCDRLLCQRPIAVINMLLDRRVNRAELSRVKVNNTNSGEIRHPGKDIFRSDRAVQPLTSNLFPEMLLILQPRLNRVDQRKWSRIKLA